MTMSTAFIAPIESLIDVTGTGVQVHVVSAGIIVQRYRSIIGADVKRYCFLVWLLR